MFTITSTSEKVNSVGGLVLAGEVFPRFGLGRGLAFREDGRRSDRVADSDVAAMMSVRELWIAVHYPPDKRRVGQ